MCVATREAATGELAGVGKGGAMAVGVANAEWGGHD